MRRALTGKYIIVSDRNTPYDLPWWLALALYAFLTLVFTYPIVLHLGSRVIGGDRAYRSLWDLWWFQHAILTLHTSPLVNQALYYPLHNVSMFWSTPVNELGALPLQPLFGSLITYNLLILAHFALSGFFAFLFLRKLVDDDLSAFVGGVVYTFSAYHFAASNTLGPSTIEFLPLFLLYFFGFIERPGMKDFLLMACFASLSVLSAPSVATSFLVLFAIAFLFYALTSNRQLLSTEKRLLGLLLTGGIAVGIAVLFYRSGSGTPHVLNDPASATVAGPQDLLGYFLPTRGDFFWHRFFADITTGQPSRYVFPGYLVLVLAFIGLSRSTIRYKGLFILVLVAALLLSWGPYLMINGPLLIPFRKSYYLVPMPYLLIGKTFLIHLLGSPGRYCLDVELMLAVFTAGALSLVTKRNVSSILATALLAIAVPLEVTPHLPFDTSVAKIPPIYNMIKSSNAIHAIYELPSGKRSNPPYTRYSYRYLYYQTYHDKPVIYGRIPTAPYKVNDFTLLNPLLQAFREPEILSRGDIIKRDIGRCLPYGLSALNESKVSVILLHRNRLRSGIDKGAEQALYKLLTRMCGKPFVDDRSTSMFFVPNQDKTVLKPVVYLGKGWGPLHYYANGMAYRTMLIDAEIRLSHWVGGYATISFFVSKPSSRIGTLDVFDDATLIARLDLSSIITPDIGRISIPSVYLHGGKNTIVLHAEEESPASYFMEYGAYHAKLLGLFISNFRIRPLGALQRVIRGRSVSN